MALKLVLVHYCMNKYKNVRCCLINDILTLRISRIIDKWVYKLEIR